MTTVRRVITAQTRDGGNEFARIEDVEPLHLGGNVLRHLVWDWPQTPTLPCHEPQWLGSQSLPEGAGGVRIETWLLPAGFPLEGSHPDAGRMHSTDTVDLMIVLEGALCLRQADDDREVTLTRGDIVVQHGAVHTSYNPFDEPCLVAYVFFGTTREDTARGR